MAGEVLELAWGIREALLESSPHAQITSNRRGAALPAAGAGPDGGGGTVPGRPQGAARSRDGEARDGQRRDLLERAAARLLAGRQLRVTAGQQPAESHGHRSGRHGARVDAWESREER